MARLYPSNAVLYLDCPACIYGEFALRPCLPLALPARVLLTSAQLTAAVTTEVTPISCLLRLPDSHTKRVSLGGIAIWCKPNLVGNPDLFICSIELFRFSDCARQSTLYASQPRQMKAGEGC